MGIRGYDSIKYLVKQRFLNSMSQDYLQAGIFSFSNGSFERSQQEQQQQQIPRDRLRIQGFEDEEPGGVLPVYETAGMFQEMFNFPSAELLENQISQAYRIPRTVPPTGAASAADWFLHRQGIVGGGVGVGLGDPKNQPHQISAAAMQLFGHNEIQGVVEGQGLSLSLSSSLLQFEASKAEEQRMEEGGIMFFGQGLGGSSFGAVNTIRNSKYSKAAQELLEEFCSVGGNGQFRKNKFKTNPSGGGGATGGGGGAGGGNPSSSSKDIPPLAAVDRVEHQRRKVKLLSMLDEVDRRYNHYCEQMQMVVNSFDMVMGFGAAVPYTCLAQKAMSRHFRCLKDAVSDKIKQTCEILGEKDAGTSGITKGETPRLKILEQSLRQQRAFNHIGIMEQEAWRPQRGLPERSVNILRAWLFEHFLNPYPSDADKHLLARQTGLSRNQVSNWFINARVRLWKPMVEEMYQQESKDEPEEIQRDQNSSSINNAQTPTPPAAAITPPGKRLEINATENDPSFMAINKQRFSENQAKISTNANVSMPLIAVSGSAAFSFPAVHESGIPRRNHADVEPTHIRFGTSSGDVSLTLGLRHAGDSSEKSPFFC